LSGYGGQPPGWQDPYGQSGWDPQGNYTQPGWQDPYAPQQGYGYGYGPPGVPRGSASSGAAIAALVCNIVAVVLCGGIFAIPGIVTAAIAMGRVQTDPESARRLTIWSWVILGISIVLAIVLIGVFVALGVFSASHGSSDSGSGSGF
jgi:hypothetical protein